MASWWLAGLAGCTVYAEVWSLFGGVGFAANLVMIAGCAGIVIGRRKELSAGIRRMADAAFSVLRLPSAQGGPQALPVVLWVVFALLLALGTSGGRWHTDTPLYHAQAIHWIETFGAVKGLGNLQSHFAYNNSCFSLYALYSFHWLGGQSFHAVQGFLAVLLMTLCLPLAEIPARGRLHRIPGRPIRVSDFLRMAAGLQIALLYDELVSPSSDCFVLLLAFAVLILWMDVGAVRGSEEGKMTIAAANDCVHRQLSLPEGADAGTDMAAAIRFAMIVMLAVYATTVKLSAAPLLLLSLKPIDMLLHNRTEPANEKKPLSEGKLPGVKCVLRFVLLAFLIFLPFLIRNLILSGWIVYPALPQHLVQLPWQVPDGVGWFENFEIRQNGRMIFDMNLADTSLTGWIYDWLVRQPKLARLLLYAALAGMIPVMLKILLNVYRNARRVCSASLSDRSTTPDRVTPDQVSCVERNHRLFTETVLIACLLFWFFTTPQIRFGEGYLLSFLAVVYGGLFCDLLRLLPDRPRRLIETPIPFIAMIVIVALLTGMTPGRDPEGQTHPVLQQDYDRYPVRTYDIDGIEICCPTDFVYTGYYDFPATRWEVTDVKALGEGIRGGFCIRN